jgi:hypothetical protein
MDALSYEEIASAMETTVPSVKSLLVRARISLAEASQARLLTCGEVRVELSEAAEGLRKISAPVRRHVRECDECADFRSQVRSNEKALAALFPVGPLLAFKGFIASKLGLGGAGGAGAGGAGATGAGVAGAGAAGAGAVGGGVAAIGGSGAAGGIGAIGGAIGTKAVAGVVTAAVLTAGAAVEVKQDHSTPVAPNANISTKVHEPVAAAVASAEPTAPVVKVNTEIVAPPVEPKPAPPAEPAVETPAAAPAIDNEEAAGQSSAGEGGIGIGDPESEGLNDATPSESQAGAPEGTGTVVVTAGGGSGPPSPPAEIAPAPAPPTMAEAPLVGPGSSSTEGEASPLQP